jgi:SHS2 domain-containing protein
VWLLRGEDSRGVGVKQFRVQCSEFGVNYETFEHEADIGIRGFGGTIAEAFENAAIALFSVIVNIHSVEAKEKRTVTVSAPDRELLLVEWLNALLSLSDIEHMVFAKFNVMMEETTLTGTAWGEKLDQERHEPNVEIKGATYHLLKVREADGRFVAQCVVDV